MRTLSSFLTHLRRQQDGVAALEFALILPLLVLLFFGVVELSNLLIADSKLRNVASSVSDILTQKTNGEIAMADLVQANQAAAQIMLPLTVTGPRLAVLVTVYRPISTTVANVLWTRLLTSGNTVAQGSALGLTTPPCADTALPPSLLPKTAGSPFNDVMQVTAVYRWTPWFATIYNGSINVRSMNYNMPRYSLVINPASDISPAC